MELAKQLDKRRVAEVESALAQNDTRAILLALGSAHASEAGAAGRAIAQSAAATRAAARDRGGVSAGLTLFTGAACAAPLHQARARRARAL